MVKKQKKKKQNINKIRLIIIVSVIAVICISLIAVLARYVTQSINDSIMTSKEFYFYSDKLKENKEIYQINNWSGVEDYTITINMNSTENNLKKVSYDIPYSISYQCSSNILCQLSKTEGIIYSSTNADTFTLKITPNAVYRNGDEVWVDIFAQSEGEYKKELQARFVLVVGRENVTYEIDDSANSLYFELNVTNTQSYYTVAEAFDNYSVGQRIDMSVYSTLSEANKEKCYSGEITLSFNPNEVRMDMTDASYLNASNIKTTRINGYTYISGMTIEIDALSSENIRFYKVDKTKNYTYPIVNNDSIIDVTIRDA